MTIAVLVEADEEWDRSRPGGWQTLCEEAAGAAIAVAGGAGHIAPGRAIELSIRLTDDAAVQALNLQWRGKDRPTNVLSFPNDEDFLFAADDDGKEADGEAGGQALPERTLGDIVLALETCAREARDKGIALADHAAHLVVHGTLHLLGRDHHDDDEAEAMEAEEVQALARIGIADPYRDVATQSPGAAGMDKD
jgi:probable rRNA maturation factor